MITECVYINLGEKAIFVAELQDARDLVGSSRIGRCRYWCVASTSLNVISISMTSISFREYRNFVPQESVDLFDVVLSCFNKVTHTNPN